MLNLEIMKLFNLQNYVIVKDDINFETGQSDLLIVL